MPPDSSKSSESELDSSLVDLRERPTKQLKYACTEVGCGAKFRRLDALDLHIFRHTGVKKHVCIYEGCDKEYRTVTHLKRHLRTTHERVEPLQKTVACILSSCKKLFINSSNMERHVREVHENPKIYKCQHCEEKFRQKLKMRRHVIKEHTGIFPYKCEKCQKGLYFSYQYERHVASCKIYTCPECKLVFDKWTLYRKHCNETKHGRNFYECEHCSKLYSKASELKRHVVAKHIARDGEKASFKCTHEGCERSYAYERNLKQHILTAHDGKRYPCDVEGCDSVFKNAHNLEKHRTREHVEGKVPVKKPTKKTTKRKKRKDAGRSKVSNLSKLVNICLDPKLDDLVRERNEAALEVAAKELEKSTNTQNAEVLNPITINGSDE